MNKGHIKPAEVINLHTLNKDMPPESTFALVKSSDMEVIRMVLPKGKEVPEHSVEGEVSVQCLKGHVLFGIENSSHELQEGDWLYLNRHQPHHISAKEDSVLLVTILFTSNSQ